MLPPDFYYLEQVAMNQSEAVKAAEQDLDKLVKRYNKNDRRPLLNKKKLKIDVKKIYQSRKKIYGLANFKINCDNIDKTKIVQKILDFYEN